MHNMNTEEHQNNIDAEEFHSRKAIVMKLSFLSGFCAKFIGPEPRLKTRFTRKNVWIIELYLKGYPTISKDIFIQESIELWLFARTVNLSCH